MSGNDLESLKITNLRGYVEPFTLSFDKDKKLCIIYGENGTGKTTLCDALDLLGSDNIGSLNDRGLGRLDKYLAPLGRGSAAGAIELKTTGTTAYSASIQAGRMTCTKPRPRVRVLRRPQLAKIVTASAANRFGAIAELVDVSGVEASEQALSNLLKQTERDAESRTARVAGAKEILEKFFITAGATGDPIAWARQEVDCDVAELHAVARALGELTSAYEGLKRRRDTHNSAQTAVLSERIAAEAAAGAVAALGRSDDRTDPNLLTLLEDAARLLSSHGEASFCPLCNGSDKAAGLSARIRERLLAMATLRAAMARDADAKRALDRAEAVTVKERAGYVIERARFQAVRAEFEGTSNMKLPASDPPEDVAELPAWLDHNSVLAEDWVRRHAELKTQAGDRERLRDLLSTYDENYTLAEHASKLLRTLELGLEHTRSTRHAFVNGLLEEISQEVGRLYDQVHPGEGLAKINLSLDTKRRASLELVASFQTSGAVPPQAYFSDSHLDTLGLCVFLALAKKRAASSTVLVLDDVLASVDEPHVDRLIEMIYHEAQYFWHVMVTTHYRPWREKLRWGWLRHGQCQVVEFGQWSPSIGPSLVRSTGEIERLRVLLSDQNFDVQAACAKSGVVLEALLDFLTELYQCKLPRKPRNEWTLGDLLPAIGKKLRALLRVEHQDPAAPNGYSSHDLGPILEELSRMAQTRNVLGAHFTRLAFDTLHSGDARTFATKVLELADLIVHPVHGWPRSSKSGSYWASGADARRLHPLQEPQ